MDQTTHETNRFSFHDFFALFGKKQPKIKTDEDVKITADKIKEEREIRKKSKYGFISPEGAYFYCEFEGHHSLAYDICFGQYETNNPEAYLTEDLGWCKIYNPVDRMHRYAVYTGAKHKLTDEQLKTLQKMELDTAKNISMYL